MFVSFSFTNAITALIPARVQYCCLVFDFTLPLGIFFYGITSLCM